MEANDIQANLVKMVSLQTIAKLYASLNNILEY